MTRRRARPSSVWPHRHPCLCRQGFPIPRRCQPSRREGHRRQPPRLQSPWQPRRLPSQPQLRRPQHRLHRWRRPSQPQPCRPQSRLHRRRRPNQPQPRRPQSQLHRRRRPNQPQLRRPQSQLHLLLQWFPPHRRRPPCPLLRGPKRRVRLSRQQGRPRTRRRTQAFLPKMDRRAARF